MNNNFDGPPPTYHLTLAHTSAHAARHVRRIVRTYLDAWAMPALAEAAGLAVTELLANVIRHVPDRRCTVVLAAEPHRLRVEVSDSSPALPEPREAGGLEECGRGLALVSMVTDGWGVNLAPDLSGKTVWFELKG